MVGIPFLGLLFFSVSLFLAPLEAEPGEFCYVARSSQGS